MEDRDVSGGPRSPNCVYCSLKPCYRDPGAPKPLFCPMLVYPETVGSVLKKYEGLVKRIHLEASLIEKEG